MFNELSKEEETKVKDFMNIFKNYINPSNNAEIDTIINYIFDTIIKVYIEYKDVVPFISVADDSYNYYILKPINGQYNLLDYLINTVIQNLDSIEFANGKTKCNYNLLMKKIFINKDFMVPPSFVFNRTRTNINKEQYLELYYKNGVYHEIGHMLHYKIENIKPNTVYVPSDYLSLQEFLPKEKRIFKNKKAEMARLKEKTKELAKERIKKRIAMYSVLSNKYSILKPEEINDCNIEVERLKFKYEEIMIPGSLYLNPVDEAFTEGDAWNYSGIFENEIFDVDGTGMMDGFYIPIDNEYCLMTYCPTHLSFSASIGLALKECISKKAYFRTVFLGKKDFFYEFLGEYESIQVTLLSQSLMAANQNQMAKIQPLLDSIIEFYKNKGLSTKILNIYFPLIFKDNKWVYYIDALEEKPSLKIPQNDCHPLN